MAEGRKFNGFAIIVLNRGFVYVGDVSISDNCGIINNAKNIRRWGTTGGLGQLALNGNTSETKLDDVGVVRVPHLSAIIHIIETEKSKWNY
jgi:hypothetical protein